MDVANDAYWREEFAITAADLDRLARFIAERESALDLNALIQRVVRGRLRHGHDSSTAVATALEDETQSAVRLWDPAATWQPGDRAIIARKRYGIYTVLIGEVTTQVEDKVTLYLPEQEQTVSYERAEVGSKRAQRWRTSVREAVDQKRAVEGEEESVELIILEYGDRLAGLLLQALRDDARFILLDGRYYLTSLARTPDPADMRRLAWVLAAQRAPMSTSDLLEHISSTVDDASRSGLYLALRQAPQWFENTQPGKQPQWRLAGPPPGTIIARHAAFDPLTYEILCLPDAETSAAAVARLWETNLLAAVL